MEYFLNIKKLRVMKVKSCPSSHVFDTLSIHLQKR